MDFPWSKGVDSVRRRPSMYVGSTDDGAGVQTIIREAIINALQEVAAGSADRIEVGMSVNGALSILDNGRGMPTENHNGFPMAAQIFTQLDGDLLFGEQRLWDAYQGVGMCVVNALSEWLKLRIWRNGVEYAMHFSKGIPDVPLAIVGPADHSGTEVTFMPDRAIFPCDAVDLADIERWLRSLKLPDANMTILLASDKGAVRSEVSLTCERGVIL